jgi:PAS domain S-box-containing protein
MRRQWVSYVQAAGAVLVAAVLRWALGRAFGPLPTFITFYPATIVCAILGGIGPGVFSTFMGMLAAALFFLGPGESVAVSPVNNVVRLVFFGSMGVLLSVLGGRLRATTRAQTRRAEAATAELEKLVQLLDLASVLVRSADDHIVRWNSGCERLYGFTVSEAVGRISHELLQTRFPAPLEEIRTQFMKRNRWEGEVVHVTSDGREVVVASQWSLWRNTSGEPVAILEANTDITARKRAEEALARERANLQAIFGVVNVGMLLIDEEGVVRRVNDTVSRWVGKELSTCCAMQPGDFVGCVHALTDPAGCGHTSHCAVCPIRNTFESVLRTREPIHDIGAEAVLSIDGKEVRLWLEASADPLMLDGKPHVVLSLNNITARKQAETTLRHTADELTRSNKELEQFAYVASHDLQEPLRMVIGFVQLLEQKYGNQLGAEADQFIAYAVDGAKRMQTLINDLLSYSRVGARGVQAPPIDARVAMERALENLRAGIQETGAEIRYGQLPTVRVEGTQLVQLFQNLVGNALKFRSDAPPKICIEAVQSDGHCQFSVSDNGIGIASEFQDRIFLIFQRLHTRQKYAGTGIGLAICKKIVDRHGGRIWVESQAGQGATFHFTLPA